MLLILIKSPHTCHCPFFLLQGVRTLTHASASFSQSQTLITAYGQGGKANLFGTTASSLAGGVTSESSSTLILTLCLAAKKIN